MNQNKLLNYLLAAMIVWVPNQLHLPADLGVKGLNSINLLFLAIIYYVHQRNKKLPPSEATPLKGVFIAYFCMLVWGFLAGQLTDRSLMMEDLTAMKNSIFFMCLYFVFFHGARDGLEELDEHAHQVVLLKHQDLLIPMCSYARSVARRPLGVRMIRPCWIRNGS